MKCRHCYTKLTHVFVDLGNSPPSNAYLTQKALHGAERWFPLRVFVCDKCWLVQTEDYASFDELFDSEYAYFSSVSASWLEHSKNYSDKMIRCFDLSEKSMVVEVASNDGYLLQFFKGSGIPCIGVEPTKSTAEAARKRGIEVITEFFGTELAIKLSGNGLRADLLIANNVLAHVPDINDFVRGFAALLSCNGVATFEFPSLINLIQYNQFDTIYHEHFSYLSLTTVSNIFAECGLKVFEVEKIPTHGGSLRVYAQRSDTGGREVSENVVTILDEEEAFGLKSVARYTDFQLIIDGVKDSLLTFLIEQKKQGKSVVGYGAAAKGNTFLNYAGVRPDLLNYVVDKSDSKKNKYMPGSRIPIVDERKIKETKPDFVLILPWNIKKEIGAQLRYIREWGGQFVTAIPDLEIF